MNPEISPVTQHSGNARSSADFARCSNAVTEIGSEPLDGTKISEVSVQDMVVSLSLGIFVIVCNRKLWNGTDCGASA